jgi:hypothetical protein
VAAAVAAVRGNPLNLPSKNVADEGSDAPTERQMEIYAFIRDKIHSRGYGPTVREIGLAFKIRSPNGVVCHLKALERKGLITRGKNMSRAIDGGLGGGGHAAARRRAERADRLRIALQP